jgi:hypothetical protein
MVPVVTIVTIVNHAYVTYITEVRLKPTTAGLMLLSFAMASNFTGPAGLRAYSTSNESNTNLN